MSYKIIIAFPLDIDKYCSGDFQSPLWQSEIAATFNVKWKCYKFSRDYTYGCVVPAGLVLVRQSSPSNGLEG